MKGARRAHHRPATIVALALASVLLVGAARQIVRGQRAMRACDEATERGDAREAIAEARIAAESLLPGSPYPRRGYERLARIAHDAEAHGDLQTSAAAWRAVRAAAQETRGLGSGSDAWTAEANAGLVRAAADSAPPVPGLPDELARQEGPTTWEILLLAATTIALYALGARFLRGRPAEADRGK